MLEFYPMPTNLSQVGGGSLYALQQNHGGARFLDNPSATTTATNNSNNNNNNNTNNNNCISSCLSNNNNNNNSISITSNASLTAQAISATTTAGGGGAGGGGVGVAGAATTTTAIGTPATPTGTLTCPANNNHNLLSCLTTNSLTAASASALTTPPTTCPTSSSAPMSASVSTASSLSSSSSSSSSSLSTTSSPTVASSQTHSSTTASSSASSSSSSSAAAAAAAAAKLSADCSGRSELGHIKCEKNFELCEGCGQKIHDRYLMSVGDASWHEQCLACCYCGLQLHHTHTCYVRNAKIYCKLDYDRLFGVKCAACCHPILPQELVMRPVPNFVFHLPCFVCYACRLPLQKGEQFLLRDGQLFCYRHDLEKELFLAAAHCGFVGLDEDELMRPRDGRRGPKRPRTILTSQQRKQFKASFDQSPKPCRKVREALAKDTGLSVRVVQVWFQNQRAKMKKIQRKAKNGGGSGGRGGGNGSAGGGSADDKEHDKSDDKCIKQELGVGSGGEGSYLGLDSAFASQPLNPNLPFSPDDYPANSNDSFCSSDLSLDGSNFDQLDDDADSLSLNNLELQSTSSSGNQHSNPHDMLANLNTSLINPIDKLYLMQNSYFNADH